MAEDGFFRAQNRVVFVLAGGYIDMPAAGAGPDQACRFVGVPWVWLICIPAGNSWLRRRGGLSVEESPEHAVLTFFFATWVRVRVRVRVRVTNPNPNPSLIGGPPRGELNLQPQTMEAKQNTTEPQ